MEEKARKFAVWNSTNYFTRDGLYDVLMIMVIFGALCFFDKSALCVLLLAFAAVYGFWLLSMPLWAKNEFSTRYLISAEAALFISLYMLIFACTFSIDKTGSYLGSIMMIAGRCIEEALCVLLTISIVGWSCYEKRKKTLLIILIAAATAGIIALLSFWIYNDIANPEKEMGKLVPLSAVLSYTCGVDGFLFVKYFYSRKYDVTEDENGDFRADKIFEKKLDKSTIGWLIVAAIFSSVIIYVSIIK